MRVRKFISVVATLALGLACGCGGKADIDSAPLLAIPSRAVAVAHFTRVDKALPLLVDSTSRLRAIDYGSLHNSEMAFCYLYSASLVPVLVIDAGHADADTSHQVKKILPRTLRAGDAEDKFLNQLEAGTLRSVVALYGCWREAESAIRTEREAFEKKNFVKRGLIMLGRAIRRRRGRVEEQR